MQRSCGLEGLESKRELQMEKTGRASLVRVRCGLEATLGFYP